MSSRPEDGGAADEYWYSRVSISSGIEDPYLGYLMTSLLLTFCLVITICGSLCSHGWPQLGISRLELHVHQVDGNLPPVVSVSWSIVASELASSAHHEPVVRC